MSLTSSLPLLFISQDHQATRSPLFHSNHDHYLNQQVMLKIKGRKNRPKISTASLPDIVFMLLFFFMVVAIVRDEQLFVDIQYPEATELTKLKPRRIVNTIYIGPPINTKLGKESRIQLNDALVSLNDLGPTLEQSCQGLPEPLRKQQIASLKIDVDTRMGIVQEVKNVLRKSNVLRLSYVALPDGDLVTW